MQLCYKTKKLTEMLHLYCVLSKLKDNAQFKRPMRISNLENPRLGIQGVVKICKRGSRSLLPSACMWIHYQEKQLPTIRITCM